MTKKDKELLLKDLCARLYTNTVVNYNDIGGCDYPLTIKTLSNFPEEKLKCYLRPMSSMTEEEKEEMHNILSPEGTAVYENNGISMPMNHYGEFVSYEFMSRIIQYMLEHHFDFMDLISKRLAIEVTESNNPYKE